MDSSLCIVLKSVDYRDNDKIVTLFSRQDGKLTAMARGAKSLKSEVSPSTQQFCCGVYNFYERNNKLYIKNCEIKKSYTDVAEDYDAYLAACSIVDVTSRILEDSDDYNDLFVLVVNCLDALLRVNAEEVMCFFIIKLLSILGIGPLLDACCVCGNEIEEPSHFSLEDGGCVCDDCAPSVRTVPFTGKAARELNEAIGTRPIDFSGNDSFHGELLILLNDYLKVMTGIGLRFGASL